MWNEGVCIYSTHRVFNNFPLVGPTVMWEEEVYIYSTPEVSNNYLLRVMINNPF